MNFVDILTNEVIDVSMTEKLFDKGGGIYVPSSLQSFDKNFFEKLKNRDCETQEKDIIKECFGIDFPYDLPPTSIVELEDELFVLELAEYIKTATKTPNIFPLCVASAIIAAYAGIDTDGDVNVFLPLVDFDALLGAKIAKDVGLPIKNIVVATNENDEFVKFLNVGKYDANRQIKQTLASQMDMHVAKNFEKFAAYLEKDDIQLIKDKFETFDKTGVLALNCKCQDIIAGSAYDDEISSVMRAFCEENDYVFDTSSVAAASVCDEYVDETGDETPAIILSVASPMERARDTLLALKIKSKDEEDAREQLEQLFAIERPAYLDNE